ncbi:MAG: hypothetical protein AAFO63_09815 [Pseudomonadota bacterium]
MANRTANYIAFDGLGETNPARSDFKYYTSIRGWAAGRATNFTYVDAHDKTYAVRDTSRRPTLESRIRQRLAVSKNVVVILSDQTRKSGSMLSYEIEQAVDKFDLPLICAYTGYNRVFEPRELSHRWPNALTDRINEGTAKAIHIPFRKNPLLDALGQFTVHTGKLSGSVNFYNVAAHNEFGC